MGKGLEEDVIPVAEALKWVQVWVAGDLQRLRDSEVGAENKGGGKKTDSPQWYQAGLGIKGPRLELNNLGTVQSNQIIFGKSLPTALGFQLCQSQYTSDKVMDFKGCYKY